MPDAKATPSSYFVAELGGKQIGTFQKFKVSGPTETSDIEIGRYQDKDKTTSKWVQEVAEKGAAAAKRDITLRRVDHDGQTIETYSLRSAWPKSYVAAELSATGDVAGEKLVLAHEGFEKV